MDPPPLPPSQYTLLSIHHFNTTSQHTLSSHTLSTHPSRPLNPHSASGISKQKAIILISLFIYIGGYQVGFGPISWLMISEIFPLEVRGKAVSLAVVTNFFWNTIMTFFFPVELDFIGMWSLFRNTTCLFYMPYHMPYNVPYHTSHHHTLSTHPITRLIIIPCQHTL